MLNKNFVDSLKQNKFENTKNYLFTHCNYDYLHIVKKELYDR